MCQQCDEELEYDWRQYGQLGSYRCPACGFRRERPGYAMEHVVLSPETAIFTVRHDAHEAHAHIPFSGAYLLYNALAVFAATDCCGIASRIVCEVIGSFEPHNGRLQRYELGEYHVLLNLAKNPTGLNQNLRIVTAKPGPKSVAIFINDKEADGHDVSWLWDVDFEELASASDLSVYAGGIRRNDLQVRLKYAGLDAKLVEGAEDFLTQAHECCTDANLYVIANYTALPEVKAELDLLEQKQATNSPANRPPSPSESNTSNSPSNSQLGFSTNHEESSSSGRPPASDASLTGKKLTILHLYPELLNLYGDGGNVRVLAERARRRGIEVEVVRTTHGQAADFSNADIVFLGGGPDREQRLASHDLLSQAEDLRTFVEDDGVLLAICGGYQILGRTWLLADESVPGLGILDLETTRAPGGSHNRLVGNIALRSPVASMPVVGYENHAGRTYLGAGCEPFGPVVGSHGKGNNDNDKADGVLYRNVLGTYLHGPLLAKNPEVADFLITRALQRHAAKTGLPAPTLPPLDDTVEQAANAFMCHKLGINR